VRVYVSTRDGIREAGRAEQQQWTRDPGDQYAPGPERIAFEPSHENKLTMTEMSEFCSPGVLHGVIAKSNCCCL
jgi:hypothetical protein